MRYLNYLQIILMQIKATIYKLNYQFLVFFNIKSKAIS